MKKTFFIVVILISLFVINNLVRSIYGLWQKQDVLTQAQNELVDEKASNTQLKQKLKEVNEPAFTESQARDKLLLVKPGESVVIIENKLIVRDPLTMKKKLSPKANWIQWWELFTR